MRWPSDNLIQQLRELKLCTKADVEACEPIVKQLCNDLPDFDSVWLDALIQQRSITPWQAEMLQSGHGAFLQVDDKILEAELGRDTFLGSDDSGAVVTHRLHLNSDSPFPGRMSTLLERLDSAISDSRQPASICLPDSNVIGSNSDVFVLSEFIAGWSASELLIRGGRFPAQAVAEIGRQLLRGLAWLEANDQVHGEIVLRNLRITRTGTVVLVAPFVKNLLHPTVSLTAIEQLRDVETTAPELVGTGRTADSQSELYSLGCVLWQLLTGRPPFLSTDPIGRMQQAQSHELPDLQTLAPDSPDWLANQIYAMARRNPDLRPRSIASIATEWSSKLSSSTAATRRIVRKLPDRAATNRRIKRRASNQATPWLPKLAAVGLLLPLFSIYAWHRGLLPKTLDLRRSPEHIPAVMAPEVVANVAETETGPQILPLPAPDAAGVVLLKSGQEYTAQDLEFAGVMHIETDGNASAAVRVPASGWNVRATHLAISGLHISFSDDPSAGASAQSCLAVNSNVLTVDSCVFDSVGGDSSGSGIAWTSPHTATQVLRISNSVFRGEGYGIWLTQAPGRCEFENVLLQQAAGGVRMDIANADAEVRMQVSRVTQLGGHSFLDLIPSEVSSSGLKVLVQSGESVLAPSSAITRIALPENSSVKNMKVEYLLPERGNPTIVPPEVDPVLYFDRSLQQFVAVDDSQVVSDALLIARPLFRGAEGPKTDDGYTEFELLDYEGPKLNPRMPGVSTHNLPAPFRGRSL